MDPAAAAKLEEALVAEEAQRTKHGIRVDAEYGGEVAGWGEPFSGFCLAVGDSAADLGCDLFEEVSVDPLIAEARRRARRRRWLTLILLVAAAATVAATLELRTASGSGLPRSGRRTGRATC